MMPEYFSSGSVIFGREENAMPAYRIYWLDHNDRIVDADHLIANSDDDARDAADAHLGQAPAVEVWHRMRRITRVCGQEFLRRGMGICGVVMLRHARRTWQWRLGPSLPPTRLPRAVPHVPGAPQILMLSNWAAHTRNHPAQQTSITLRGAPSGSVEGRGSNQ
jgi:hypothetical protein